ncbi:WhiB family transcriptional regulator [Streptomyces sp. NPDC101249]|uniref:WhiB family transcriptional regulator n=1 Tax=Streptomyces sp. NPDC101249 TaxID=3366140 RepID=UPI003826C830
MANHTPYEQLTTHRHYKYRGCAPDPDNPQHAAGNPTLPLDTWHSPDQDHTGTLDERRTRVEAAKTVCRQCPVLTACALYANTTTPDGKRLLEPDGIMGGETALHRHKAFIRRRHQLAAATPDAEILTPQRQQVLTALAAHTDPHDVAQAARVDIRTANWQRARLVTQLNLDKTSATRRELLNAAVQRGLLQAADVVPDDGTVPAIPAPGLLKQAGQIPAAPQLSPPPTTRAA